MKVKAKVKSSEEPIVDAPAVDEERGEVDVATEKTNKALEVVYNEFGLKGKGYILSAFADKGNTVKLEVFNGEFTLNVVIHDCEKHGINRKIEQEGKDE